MNSYATAVGDTPKAYFVFWYCRTRKNRKAAATGAPLRPFPSAIIVPRTAATLLRASRVERLAEQLAIVGAVAPTIPAISRA